VKIKRAEKYGFCAGVRIADRKVKKFAREGEREGFILGQVVHNERVVEEMEQLGVHTVQGIGEVGRGTIVFSAHGVPPSYHEAARQRGLSILDTTCPFVYDIHDEAVAALAAGAHLVFIGDPKHREVIGYTNDLDPASYHVLTSVEEAAAIDWSRYSRVKILYQTTLNADDYEDVARYIESRVPTTSRADTICYATKENQDAARALAGDPEIGVIVVIGGKKSANTHHLWEICARQKPSHLIQDAADLDPAWFEGVAGVGITAGASTPDYVIEEVEAAIARLTAPAVV
jgi:4-hydroxy-3-methylbut-2-enyl diphosphate reductase